MTLHEPARRTALHRQLRFQILLFGLTLLVAVLPHSAWATLIMVQGPYPQATVRVDDQDSGVIGTGLSVEVPAGPHQIQVSMAGYEPFEVTVNVNPSVNEVVNVTMLPKPTITIQGPYPQATVQIDARSSGVIGKGLSVEVPTGPHKVVVSQKGFQPYEATVNVGPNGNEVVNVTLLEKKNNAMLWLGLIGGSIAVVLLVVLLSGGGGYYY